MKPSYNEYCEWCVLPNQLLNRLVAYNLRYVPRIVNVKKHIYAPLVIQCYIQMMKNTETSPYVRHAPQELITESFGGYCYSTLI